MNAPLRPPVIAAPTPPAAPLAMAPQDLRAAPAPRPRFARADARTMAARLITFGGAAALTLWAARQMTLAFDPETVSGLQLALRALFVATFGWIAVSACAAVAGALIPPRRRSAAHGPTPRRTAIVMPIYQEDAAACFARLAALAEGLDARGAAAGFEIFVISDTRDADAWARETTAFAAMRARLGGRMPCWYRRRADNTGRKAGNVQEFVARWGGRYELMLMLDADSLMDAGTVETMARRMAADPGLGLLQTNPALLGAETPFARLQQFAGALHGRVAARGVAAWQGLDGNFWGHNAMIRVRAFAESAGLPELPGRAPFGGHVMSHDFVEAALLRRAGWGVRMDTDLRGSWEGAPPSLGAFAARDRRWAQGNLQHAKVIGAKGLRWPSRAHLAIGIGSYLASPLWLAMIVVGLALTAQAAWFRPEYFPQAFQLFPSWPRFDAARMTWLFGAAMGVLLAPKIIGLLGGLLSREARRGFGGGLALIGGALVELLLSALVAPAMMLIQTGQLADILAGRDSGWSPQARAGATPSWREAMRAHGGQMVVGVALAAALWFTQPGALLWLSPVIAGLILAPALARWSADPRLGAAMARLGLLASPDERRPPEVAAAAARAEAEIRAASARDLADLGRVPALADAHRGLMAAGAEPVPRVAAVTARAKIAAARDDVEAAHWLDRAERAAIAADPALFRRFAARFAESAAPPDAA